MNVNPYPLIGTTCLIEATFLFYLIQMYYTCKGQAPWFNFGDWESPRALIYMTALLKKVYEEQRHILWVVQLLENEVYRGKYLVNIVAMASFVVNMLYFVDLVWMMHSPFGNQT